MPRAGSEASEERPLLSPGPGDDDHAAADGSDNSQPERCDHRRVIAVTFLMVVLVDLAAFFMEAPLTSILEANICRRYYNEHGRLTSPARGERRADCNVGPVQTELATVVQMLNTFNRLPGFITAIPFGMAADRYGRRPVLLVAILGALLQDVIMKAILWRPDLFSPRLVWLSSAALLVGGGDAVAGSMIFLVVADVAPARQRASLFFLLTACGLVAEVVGTPLSALLMSKDPWIPYFLYSVLTLLGGTVPLLFLPETLPPSPPARLETSTRRASCEDTSEPSSEERPAGQAATNAHRPRLPSLSALCTAVNAALSKLGRIPWRLNVVAILLAYFVSALGRQSTSFLLQYLRHRFDWSYEKASILITVRAAMNLALLLVGLPVLNKILVARGMSAAGKDLLIARCSVFFYAAGSLVLAVAPAAALAVLGIVVFALGSGFAPAARSLATSFCHADEAGLLYSALALTQSVGGLVAGPLLALSFRWALSLGPGWTGIPFVAVAGLYACGLLAVSLIRLKKTQISE